MDTLPIIVNYGLIFAIGACLGSAVSALSYRLPFSKPVLLDRSRCPKCNTILRVRDLMPLISWCLARRRCRYCQAPVHWRYPLIELIMAVGVLALYMRYGMSVEWVLLSALLTCVATLIVTDLEHYIIPDIIQIAMSVIAVCYSYVTYFPFSDMIVGAAIGLSIGLTLHYGYFYFRGTHGLGLGDVKLLMVAGGFLGAESLLAFLFFSGVAGILTAILWRLLGKGAIFPFGPALASTMFAFIIFPHLNTTFFLLIKSIY